LNQPTAGYLAHMPAVRARGRGGEDAHIFSFCREKRQRSLAILGRYYHISLGICHHSGGQLFIDKTGKSNYATEGRHGIAFEGFFVGFHQTGSQGCTTRVGVLDDHGRRRRQVGNVVHQDPRRVGVVQIEVGKLHPSVLGHFVPPAMFAGGPVTSPALMRVLAVAERLGQFE
jgi:hypothetical protein